ANVLPGGEGQDLFLDFAVQQRVARLKRRDRGDGLGTLHLLDVKNWKRQCGGLCPLASALPGRPNPPRCLRRGQASESDTGRWFFHPKPSQTGFAFAPYRVSLETAADPATLVPDHAAFREDIGPIPHSFESAGDDFLGVTQPVDSSGVNP